MKDFQVKVREAREICENTLLLELERPQDFDFKAGQFLMIELENLSKDVLKGNNRPMSIASPPSFNGLQIVFRRGITPFKKQAELLKSGDRVLIKGPYGAFILDNDDKEIVFLAGGVGITPIRSMIWDFFGEDLKGKDKAKKIYLFYSNLSQCTTAFLEEFKTIQKKQKESFKFIPTMTDEQGWKGEKGFINIDMLKKYIADIKNPKYFIVGPPAFVENMKNILEKSKVEVGKIKIEKF